MITKQRIIWFQKCMITFFYEERVWSDYKNNVRYETNKSYNIGRK